MRMGLRFCDRLVYVQGHVITFQVGYIPIWENIIYQAIPVVKELNRELNKKTSRLTPKYSTMGKWRQCFTSSRSSRNNSCQ